MYLIVVQVNRIRKAGPRFSISRDRMVNAHGGKRPGAGRSGPQPGGRATCRRAGVSHDAPAQWARRHRAKNLSKQSQGCNESYARSLFGRLLSHRAWPDLKKPRRRASLGGAGSEASRSSVGRFACNERSRFCHKPVRCRFDPRLWNGFIRASSCRASQPFFYCAARGVGYRGLS